MFGPYVHNIDPIIAEVGRCLSLVVWGWAIRWDSCICICFCDATGFGSDSLPERYTL